MKRIYFDWNIITSLKNSTGGFKDLDDLIQQ